MAFALFEENGDLKAGTVMTDNGTSLQVELVTGRRAKIKAAHVYLRFESPSADALLPAAHEAAEAIDIDFLWECAPADEFGFQSLAAEYFGDKPDPVQLTALLVKLKSAPIYFQRKGRGQFRAAPQEQLQAALAAVEKRRQRDALVARHAEAMAAGELPDEVAAVAVDLLVRPDKMSLEYQAFDKAMAATRKPAERLLLELGAFASPYDLHFRRFTAEQFPFGAGFPASLEQWEPDAETAERLQSLPVSSTAAFSIDDSSTTEIDDALSVHRLEDGRYRVGIHIAAPAMNRARTDVHRLYAGHQDHHAAGPGGRPVFAGRRAQRAGLVRVLRTERRRALVAPHLFGRRAHQRGRESAPRSARRCVYRSGTGR